jgi:hypothetical protein
MKIDHLNFAQLYKLQHQRNIVRFENSYYAMMERRWRKWAGVSGAKFRFSSAEDTFVKLRDAHRGVLRLLRSRYFAAQLRHAADLETPLVTPGYAREFRAMPWTFRQDAQALATLIKAFVLSKGVPAFVVRYSPRVIGPSYSVMVETDETGCALLTHKTGWRVQRITEMTGHRYMRALFPWLPAGISSGRINPCNWPCNTPDVDEVAKRLVH